ncbi:MAG: DUF2271 domain-containing protein [Deltaproteobacteria bacterium]
MQSLRIQCLRNSGALLILSCLSVTIGCSSQYEPGGQYWTNLGPDSFGVSSTAAESDAGFNEPTADEDDLTGVAGDRTADGVVGGTSTVNRSPTSAPSTASPGGSTAVLAASPSCSLSVSVTTTAPGGKYRPRNVGAIWIADSADRFVKSLDVWGNRRLSHVTAWTAATRAAGVAGNKVDAVSSATLSAHRAHDVTWNCKDYTGKVMPDGTYRVYFEVADSNTSGPNHFESFVKSPSAATTQSSATNFNGIVLTFKP